MGLLQFNDLLGTAKNQKFEKGQDFSKLSLRL